jgi:phosphoribosyl 1,2-cyclic phosphodiesterase
MLGFCPLASGSKGNALYLGSKKTKILIDAGLSAKELKERLLKIGVSIEEIQGVLVTHEHIDHIRGISTLCQKYEIPVFANIETAKAILSVVKHPPKFKIFATGDPFQLADLYIHPFSIPHDAMDPVAFTFQFEQIKIGVCADLGFASSLVVKQLQGCDYLYIEANHQPSRVHACSRPLVYKQRVLSRQGHLSNEESASVVTAVHHDNLKHVYLAHLSSECNSPDLALQIVSDALERAKKKVAVSIAPQDEIAMPVYFS